MSNRKFQLSKRPWVLKAAGTLIALLAISCSDNATSTGPTAKHCTGSGLCYEEIRYGIGPKAAAGMMAEVQFTGWLANNGEKGQIIEKSNPPGPISFRLGSGAAISGFDEGVTGMRPGGKRELIIPPELAYGSHGIDGLIPPNSTLIIDVELVRLSQ